MSTAPTVTRLESKSHNAADEIRTPEFDVLSRPVELRKQELAMATSLMEMLTERFDPTQFVDSYRERL